MSNEVISDTQVTPCAESLQTDVLLVPKQSIWMFVTTELFVYFSQVIIFFFVAVFTSNLLRDEKQLVSYITSKVNENTLFEVVATMLAIATTLGIIAGIAKAIPKTQLIERLVDEVLSEAPRTAYIFGSSVSGTLLAIALYIQLHPHAQSPPVKFWLIPAIFAALAGFMYGCFFAYAFKHKAHIKASSLSSSNSKSAP
jgi:hypothetical protein